MTWQRGPKVEYNRGKGSISKVALHAKNDLIPLNAGKSDRHAYWNNTTLLSWFL